MASSMSSSWLLRVLFSVSLLTSSFERLTAVASGPEGGSYSAPLTSEAPMNVLMIVVDDFRPPVSALQPTPNIDRLKAAGVSFSRAYTQIATCSPSRTSALTGLRPDKTHVWSIGPYFRTTMGRRKGPSTVTLPQLFKENGYNTTGSGKVFHPGSSSGSDYKSEGGGDMPYSWSTPYFL